MKWLLKSARGWWCAASTARRHQQIPRHHRADNSKEEIMKKREKLAVVDEANDYHGDDCSHISQSLWQLLRTVCWTPVKALADFFFHPIERQDFNYRIVMVYLPLWIINTKENNGQLEANNVFASFQSQSSELLSCFEAETDDSSVSFKYLMRASKFHSLNGLIAGLARWPYQKNEIIITLYMKHVAKNRNYCHVFT